MKRIFILITFCVITQLSFGQACGVYRIKYVGKLITNSMKIEKIKLPSTVFLHGLKKEKSEKLFIEIELNNNEVNNELQSHLTSNLYEDSKSLLNFYMTKNPNIPIKIIATENGKKKNIQTELSWDTIQITKLNDDKFGNSFELNFNKINIDK